MRVTEGEAGKQRRFSVNELRRSWIHYWLLGLMGLVLAFWDIFVTQGKHWCLLQKVQPAILFICIYKRKVKQHHWLLDIQHICEVNSGGHVTLTEDWLTSLRMAQTAESFRTESRSARTGLKEGSTAPSATPFSKWPVFIYKQQMCIWNIQYTSHGKLRGKHRQTEKWQNSLEECVMNESITFKFIALCQYVYKPTFSVFSNTNTHASMGEDCSIHLPIL